MQAALASALARPWPGVTGWRVNRSSAHDSPHAVVSRTRDQQRYQLACAVAPFVIVRPSSSAVRNQHGQRVGACGQIGIGSAVGDLGVQQGVGFSIRRSLLQSRLFSRLGLASVSVRPHAHALSSRGMTRSAAASWTGSLAPMTVRRITSGVISDILGATRERLSHRPPGDVMRNLGYRPALARDRVSDGTVATSGDAGRGARRRRSTVRAVAEQSGHRVGFAGVKLLILAAGKHCLDGG